MRIYIAASVLVQPIAFEFARRLEFHGVEVVSTWHNRPIAREAEEHDWSRKWIADMCFSELQRANTCVYLHHSEARGALVEAGFALASGRTVYCVGKQQEATLMLAHCEWFANESQAIERLKATS